MINEFLIPVLISFGLSLLIAIILGGIEYFILKRKKFPELKSFFVYGSIGIIMLFIGIGLLFTGFTLMLVTEITKDFLIINTLECPTQDPETECITAFIQKILELAEKQSLEIKHSEGIAIAGVGSGIILASIPILYQSAKDRREFYKTIDFLKTDLEGINNKLVTVIHNLQDAVKDLGSKKILIDKLLDTKISPVEIFGSYITGLYFELWDSYFMHIREFKPDEQKIIFSLHGFILTANRIMEPKENSLVAEIERILRESKNKADELNKLLKFVMEDNLNSYKTVHKRLHTELDEIEWIHNREWKKVSDIKPENS